jgi:uncharacterized membrane protein YhaH (DUF805 family)
MSNYWPWLLFSFHGRTGRLVYFFTILVIACCNFAIVARSGLNVAALRDPSVANSLSALSSLLLQQMTAMALSLVLAWVNTAVSVKRLHDINLSGWFLLLPFGLLVGGGVLAVAGSVSILLAMALAMLSSVILGGLMLFKPGSDGENRFPRGPSPDGDSDGASRLSKISFDKESMARYALQSSAASSGARAQASAPPVRAGAPVKSFGRRGVER